MRKRTTLTIPLLLLAALAATVLVEIPEETGLPPGAQAQLDGFVAEWYPAGDARVECAVRAGRPWGLSQDQSLDLVGTSIQFFHVRGESRPESYYPQRLRYPPKEVWCVLLEPEATAEAGSSLAIPRDLVVVALHTSLYESGWTVHVPREAWPAGATVKALAAMGCNLGLDTVGPLNTSS